MNKPIRAILWLITALATLPLYNLLLDPYGIFGIREHWQGLKPNERFVKYQYLVNQGKDTEYLLFGASRAGHIPFTDALGENAYNMAYSVGLTQEHYLHLKQLVKHLPKLKTVYLSIDDVTFKYNPQAHHHDYLRESHPEVSGHNAAGFYLRHLFRPLSNLDFDYHFGETRAKPEFVYDIDGSGREHCYSCEESIANDVDTHRQQPTFSDWINPLPRYSVDETIEDLENIVSLLREHNINLVVFFNPSFVNNLRVQSLPHQEAFKRAVAAIVPYHDFLVYDPRVADPANFYEVLHYRPLLGREIMSTILQSNASQAHGNMPENPSGFGALVIQATVDTHLDSVRTALIGKVVKEEKYRFDQDLVASVLANPDYREAQPLTEPPANNLREIDCHYDNLKPREKASRHLILEQSSLDLLELRGWANGKLDNTEGHVLIESRDMLEGNVQFRLASGLTRRDVGKVHGKQRLHSGFYALMNLKGLTRGNYFVKLIYDKPGVSLQCRNPLYLSIL